MPDTTDVKPGSPQEAAARRDPAPGRLTLYYSDGTLEDWILPDGPGQTLDTEPPGHSTVVSIRVTMPDDGGLQVPGRLTAEIGAIWQAVQRPVIAQLVHARDGMIMVGANIPPTHEAEWFGYRGEVTGGYAYVDYGNGLYSLVVRMSATEFRHCRDNAVDDLDAWQESPEEMCLLTLVRELRKWIPVTP